MLLLLLASRFIQAGLLPRFVLGGLELLGAEHGYRWARPVVLLRLSGASKGCPTAAGGQVLCNFNLWAACGARAAAYEALFVQRRAAAKALFLQFVLAWVPAALPLDVYQSSNLCVVVRDACWG